MSKREQNLTQAGTILLLSAIIVKLIGALFKIPLSSDYALGDLGFGYFSAVYDLYTPIYTLALSGFPVAIAKITADITSKNDINSEARLHFSALKLVFLIGIIVTFLFCAITFPMILLQSENKSAVFGIIAIAPSVLVCSIVSVYRGYFEGRKNMFPPAISNIIEALGKLVLGLLGAIITVKLTKNPALASAAALLGITLGTVVSLIYIKLRYNKDNRFVCVSAEDKKYQSGMRKELLAIIIPVAIASLSMGIVGLIDSLTLRPLLHALLQKNNEYGEILLAGTSYKNVSISEISTIIYGIKSKAHTLFHLAPTLTMSFGIGAVPLVTQYFAVKDKENVKKNVDSCLKFSAVLSMPIALGCLFLSFGIMTLLYSDKSAVLGGRILQLYSIASLFAALTIPTTALLQGISRQKEALISIGTGVALKLILNLILVPTISFNVYGAVIASLICFGVTFLLNLIFLIKGLGFVPDVIGTLVKPLIAALVCTVTAYFVGNMITTNFGTVLAIGFAGIIYVVFLLLLKVITVNDAKELLKIN
ncbi:MAG: polysaccharide biosynthesis C-terminal domain-containing protein [Clostridia bacterium]|nr:polysaccharide biosynthesis C-terminal domain-containing protein [Clostridia bacterium]